MTRISIVSLVVLIAAMSLVATPSAARHCKGGHASDPECPPPAPSLQEQIDNLQDQIDLITPKIIFITSSEQPGDFGGLAGADAICNDLAQAVPLPGTYLAWLSDSTASPSTRNTQSELPYPPYVRTDGKRVADSYMDLTDGSIANLIDRDENGIQVGNSNVATGTNPDGTGNAGGQTYCNNWESTAGSAVLGQNYNLEFDKDWTNKQINQCSLVGLRLYCIQQ